MKTLHLWVPDEPSTWGGPRVIEVGSNPPQPGKVYEIAARNKAEGLGLLKASLSREPDVTEDPEAWGRWKATQNRVRLVATAARSEPQPSSPKALAAWKRTHLEVTRA